MFVAKKLVYAKTEQKTSMDKDSYINIYTNIYYICINFNVHVRYVYVCMYDKINGIVTWALCVMVYTKFSICCVIIMTKHIVIIQVWIVESFGLESIDMGSLLQRFVYTMDWQREREGTKMKKKKNHMNTAMLCVLSIVSQRSKQSSHQTTWMNE